MKYLKLNWILVVFGCVLLFGNNVQSQIPVVFQQGLGGYEGTHDTFFMTGDPVAINYEQDEWEWDGEDAGGFNFGFLRFDDIVGANPGQIPPDSTVIDAFLTLHVTNEGDAAQIATMHELLIPFNEESDLIDFGDGFEPRSGIDYTETPLHEIPGPSNGAVLRLEVTDSIRKVLQSGDNFGWIFIPGGTNGVSVASSEASSNRPLLMITIEGDEPPTGVREISSNGSIARGFTPAKALDISITVSLSVGAKDVKVVETIPTGWTATDISDGGSLANGVITWNIAGLSGSKTVTYKVTPPASPSSIAVFSGIINDIPGLMDNTSIMMFSPLYKTGNVLAIGVWNESNTSSDLAVTAELTDNNGVIYAQDSSAEGGWPSSTIFRWKTVLYDNGAGQEEPGWYLRDYSGDTEANGWIIQTDIGFTVGHGGNDGENGETLLGVDEETVYTRSIFDAQNYNTITELTLKLEGDDAALAWLNGVYIGFVGAGNSDRGETPPNYVFDTTTDPDSGGVDANPSTYAQSEAGIFTIPVDLIEGEPVSVPNWSLY